MRFSFGRPLEYYIRSNVFMTFSLNITAERMQFFAKPAAYFPQKKKGLSVLNPCLLSASDFLYVKAFADSEPIF